MKTITPVQMFASLMVRRFALPALTFLLVTGCAPTEAPVAQAVPAPTTNGLPVEVISTPDILMNQDFEGGSAERTEPTPNPKTKAQINGMIGGSWWDNSDWGPVIANYSLDTEKPHGGKYAQKIEFVKLADTKTYGQVQFAQRVMVATNHPYHASIWIRASEPEVPVEFGIQNNAMPYNTKMTLAKVGTEWRKLEHSLTPNPGGEKYFMVTIKKPGVTVWVDDAKLDTGSAAQ